MKRAVTIWSEGTRLAGDLFTPDDLAADEKRPAILLCHGWGGPKQHLSSTYAPFFCEAGFVCLTFDYRGWFESDARLVVDDAQPEPDADGYVSVRARPVREVVDPLDQIADITNCLDFLVGEESVDTDRVGIWGSSYGSGHVVQIAGTDSRIRCLVSQVGAPNPVLSPEITRMAQQRATEKARGSYGPMPPGIDGHPTLAGKPDWAKMSRYRPIDVAPNIRVPTLLIDQEQEELFDRNEQYPKLVKIIEPNAPVAYHTLEGTHYDVYDKNYRQSARLARDWFVEHLKRG
jgi:dipeptidyl aminopeptidase/acylaminoacyl peptidase